MKHGVPAALTLSTMLLAGCASRAVDCSDQGASCGDLGVPCTPVPDACHNLPPGATAALVDIDASPTPAAIHLDGVYIGMTPLRYPLFYTSQTRSITVVAEPLYPAQTRQERQLRIPPLPNRIQFFMNNPPAAASPDE